MPLLKRISQLVAANINHLLDQAEDPELMVKQLIRDMEESIVEVRRETVRAVARQKQLEKQIAAASELNGDLEEKAKLALAKGDEALARQVVAKKLQTARTRESLEKEQHDASELAVQLKSDLSRLEDQVQVARRKRDELIRRKRAAEAQQRTQEASRRSSEALRAASSSVSQLQASADAFDSYETEIQRMEAEAEAEKEVLNAQIEKELDLQKFEEESAIDQELARLKQVEKKEKK
jgi:phage shock protein A